MTSKRMPIARPKNCPAAAVVDRPKGLFKGSSMSIMDRRESREEGERHAKVLVSFVLYET